MTDRDRPSTQDVLFGSSAVARPESRTEAERGAGATKPRSMKDVLYNNRTVGIPAIHKKLEARADELSGIGVSGAQRAERLARFERIYTSTDLPYGFVVDLLDKDIEADLQEHRDRPLDEAQRKSQADALRTSIVGLYGRDRGEKMIARAEKFIAEHKDLADVLMRRDIAVAPGAGPNDVPLFAQIVAYVNESEPV